jgi:hypothetical protein
MTGETIRTEEIKVDGEAIISTIKQILHEGNVRRITIKNEEGKTLMEIPLTIGVVGVLLLPTLAAIGALAALVAHVTILLEKVEEA